MTKQRFSQRQTLNSWVNMLDAIYGTSQNANKTPYEILSHLIEVSGIFAKLLFKKEDTPAALNFLPKLFAWAIALLKVFQPGAVDLETMILRKFPGVCHYCTKKPCRCSTIQKPEPNIDTLQQLYKQFAPQQKRGLDDFEQLFIDIYGSTWNSTDFNQCSTINSVLYCYIRLIEELGELAEAVRFYQLFPLHFENEISDFISWWFAVFVTLRRIDGNETFHSSELLWTAYPGTCTNCHTIPCLCPKNEPVRQLMSKPPLGSIEFDNH